MKMLEMPVAEAKRKFSEAVGKAALASCRIIITKRSRPVAAIVNMEDLHRLEEEDKRGGLASIMGQWKRYDEIEGAVTDAVNARRREKSGRHVSL